VALADEAEEGILLAFKTLLSGGLFLSVSPKICWRAVGFMVRCIEGGAGKSDALLIDGGGLRFFLLTLAVLLFRLVLCIEGKSETLLIEGGGGGAITAFL